MVVIFASNNTMGFLQAAQGVFVDGTFKMCPKLWTQILVITAQVGSNMYIPCLFALLPCKKTIAYDKVFNFITNTLREMGLGTLMANFGMADFERAIRTAWKDNFPHIKLRNCYFHYTKVKL